jgi:hypothetical protein
MPGFVFGLLDGDCTLPLLNYLEIKKLPGLTSRDSSNMTRRSLNWPGEGRAGLACPN